MTINYLATAIKDVCDNIVGAGIYRTNSNNIEDQFTCLSCALKVSDSYGHVLPLDPRMHHKIIYILISNNTKTYLCKKCAKEHKIYNKIMDILQGNNIKGFFYEENSMF